MDLAARLEDFRRRRGEDAVDDYLGCSPADLREPLATADVTIIEVYADSPVDLIRETLDVNERGFDPYAEPVSATIAEDFRTQLTDACAITIRHHGTGVAAGMVLPVREGLTEIVGVATLADHRRQGFGALTTATLARIAFTLGADLVLLSTEDAGARRVYERVGFRAL
ncbi:GNAT family N-acetyltransferase [Hamadaea tsunoensis]|uniref:GNAT family N-acetyltransferase n=1 Tax=Hamadaea tsunoensis TaxID=53368 RepID=UPI0004153A4B|nr:GNAT family N-acetyltransferase [Hamadaea tsunoensis]